MLFKILNVATFVLMAWLITQQNQLSQQVQHLQQQQIASAIAYDENHKDNQQHLELTRLSQQITEFTKQQALRKTTSALALEKNQQAFKKSQRNIKTLYTAYILVLEAEMSRHTKDLKTALEKLKSSKSPIWKSGSNFPSHKKSLQGLMKHIDTTVAAWQKGDSSRSTQAIYSVIKQILQKQGQ